MFSSNMKKAAVGAVLVATAGVAVANQNTSVHYGYEQVGDQQIFYREAGDPDQPTVVLLHGFPASSHQYREVLEKLSDQYHLIAPDYPGFGSSSYPSPAEFTYNFDNLAKVIDQFLDQKGISKYSLMMQDYGAPVGFRIATAHPERVQTIITQNGNAYLEGISPKGWGPVLDYWKDKSAELEKIISENVFSYEGMKWQFTHGTQHPDSILPDSWELAYARISRPGQHQVQLKLFYDYQNNLKLYPQWQQYLTDYQPSVLVVWGKNDAFFPESGAEGYKRDVEDLDYNIYDTGHFALEEKGDEIIAKIRRFLATRVK
ncbi:alpha/beta fold hydrolase [Neptunicella sp. SCSIO 80796]|uniref:alpha/beta fold hydrolase n=1 Tax=Neptunicella plasticusilytica TaxID=3117012 RepID=UPI003A4E2D97